MFELKIASVFIFLSNIFILIRLPLIILRDKTIYEFEWFDEILTDVQSKILFIVLRLDLIGFVILGISVGLMLISLFGGIIFKVTMVPYFCVNAATSIYFIDTEADATSLDYWSFFRITRI